VETVVQHLQLIEVLVEEAVQAIKATVVQALPVS
jgi:hypothetical protein